MKAMKFKVKEKEHSEAIQAKLFELGYRWGERQPKFEYTNAKALYAGYFGGEEITYSYDLHGFGDIGNYNCEEYILSPQGEFVKVEDYYKQPETPPVLEKVYEPIGLLPKHIHDKQRMYEILDAMRRYVEAGKKIPMMWIAELDDLGGEYVEEGF